MKQKIISKKILQGKINKLLNSDPRKVKVKPLTVFSEIDEIRLKEFLSNEIGVNRDKIHIYSIFSNLIRTKILPKNVSKIIKIYNQDSKIRQMIINEIITTETYLFRGGKPFFYEIGEASKTIYQKTGKPTKIWSIPGSCGAEALSIAIYLKELGIPNKIVTTDINDIINTGRNGVFAKDIIDDSPWKILYQNLINKYLIKEDNKYSINKSLIDIDNILFEQKNIFDTNYNEKFDIIASYNFFYHLSDEAIKKTIILMNTALKRKGIVYTDKISSVRISLAFKNPNELEKLFYLNNFSIDTFSKPSISEPLHQQNSFLSSIKSFFSKSF
jgi:chemotaxis methyl-accepting protein methylase